MVLRGFTIDQKPLKDHMKVVGHKEVFLFCTGFGKGVGAIIRKCDKTDSLFGDAEKIKM